MKLGAKRNKAKNSSINNIVDKWQHLNLPPEIIQLLRSKKTTSLHYMSIICITKWWVPPASRCSSRTQYPEFRHLGNSSNTSSAQTHFYGDYIIHNAARDCRQIMAYSSKDLAWVGYDCDPLDPFDTKKKCTEFTGLLLQGNLASIDSRLTLTGIHINKGAPSANWRLFREHLFEMDEGLFLIFLIHKKSIEIVDHVEVFGLCRQELKWIKVESMKGKTVFLDGRCCWVNSDEICYRGDCVYFTQGEENCWWIFDMQSSCISVVSLDKASDFL